MRLLCLLSLALLACNHALDLPGAQPQAQCPGQLGCDEPDCSAASSASACEQRSECYAEYSLDEMCDSSGCDSHFLSCKTGPVDCHVAVTCTVRPPSGSCDSGFIEIIGAGGCSWLCVRAALCDSCAAHTDETSCENDGACHARFDDVVCAGGPCDPVFSRCESGPAQCSPGTPHPDSCTEMLEVCATEDNFVPGYLPNACPDGCVRPWDCPLSNGE